MISGSYRRGDMPPGALVGLPVSAGTMEGRARVIFDMAEADLEPGDILVTKVAGPSLTHILNRVSGVVAELGGSTSHLASIARERGIHMVLGVLDALNLLLRCSRWCAWRWCSP